MKRGKIITTGLVAIALAALTAAGCGGSSGASPERNSDPAPSGSSAPSDPTPPPNPPAPLSIATTGLPPGTVGNAYAVTLVASGGTSPYQWSLTSGSLPSGLSLNAATGAITGTP
ncbi:MAG: putative Ig domain-containing protein, partial [Gammaproteobacteria bacterium]|nr:putative Ig domain-containing protein [Gammaproteobacteria bacterium]